MPTLGISGIGCVKIAPARFGDADAWAEHAEKLFGQMTEQDGVRLPADRRYANRLQSQSNGITIPESLHATIKGLV